MNAEHESSCAHDTHCITCSDAACAMRLLSVDESKASGICVDEAGQHSEVLLGLITTPAPGDLLLVHAGAALQRLDETPTELP